ncbi:hypothetical protein FACS1894178_5410 [Bacteroidia bacterium]|nr:hypothetical protein FACS1894178_5410 [Bacteroidia bacterium]
MVISTKNGKIATPNHLDMLAVNLFLSAFAGKTAVVKISPPIDKTDTKTDTHPFGSSQIINILTKYPSSIKKYKPNNGNRM